MNNRIDSRTLQTLGEKMNWWNIPNTITSLRIILTIFLFVTLAFHRQLGYLPSLILFLVAAGTDWLDGFLARRLRQVTSLGRVLDPFADKLIICGTFVFLAADPKMLETPGGLHPWIVVVIISRELLITGLRSFLEGQTVDFSAKWSGKFKMAFQCILAVVAFLYLDLEATPTKDPGLWTLLVIFTYGTLILTVYSGVAYVIVGLRQLRRLEA
ncbi:CDP-diacylglycerol--glycerol-3-phosphate 3-phosphatidyltransferase [Thermogutta sp.]|uniref:CDP-diacylglycerol--glycerol-3-phosphate 3-phosphatidyltransferase n=1 Tax=Thermogutta sp. TaxID=1962930 RepID=UPI00321F9BA2